jgi:hypothetical protein
VAYLGGLDLVVEGLWVLREELVLPFINFVQVFKVIQAAIAGTILATEASVLETFTIELETARLLTGAFLAALRRNGPDFFPLQNNRRCRNFLNWQQRNCLRRFLLHLFQLSLFEH